MQKNTYTWPFRAISIVLAGIQSITGILPVAILASTGPHVSAATPDSATQASHPRTVTRRPAFEIKPSVLPHFSSPPTEAELFSVHVFSVPLVPVGNPRPEENKALATALTAYVQRSHAEDQSSLINFMQQYPHSAWKPALLVNLGIIWRQTGYFSRAKDAWTEAWDLSKGATETRSKALADRALGELVQLYAWIGGYAELQPIFKEIGNRKLTGGAAEMLADARDGLWVMNHSPQAGFLCGPYALQQLLAQAQHGARSSVLINAKSTRQGVSLFQLNSLADQAGMRMQMARRHSGAEFIVGSVVHWKLNHYGALLEEKSGHYLIGDSTFSHIYGKQLWISKAALEEESDGYFLVPGGPLPAGWQSVSPEEAKNVWGKGTAYNRDPDFCQKCPCHDGDDGNEMAGGADDDPGSSSSSDPGSNDGGSPGFDGGGGIDGTMAMNSETNSADNYGMAGYNMTLLDVGLYITDTPLHYHPPLGPGIKFKVTYNQRDPSLEALANQSNLGADWTCDWFIYISDYGRGGTNSAITRYDPNIGNISYSISNATTGVYFPDRFGNILQYNSTSDSYTLTCPNGAKMVFGYANTSQPGPRLMLVTSESDPAGNALTFSYDSNERLAQVNDALGQTTTLYYDSPEDIYKVTRVEDPFGRVAYLHYDELWRLQKITDEIGMSSAFTYDSGDFVTELTTPYGVTRFSYGDDDTQTGARWLYVTDPNGDHEYLYSPPTTDTDEAAVSAGDKSEVPQVSGSPNISNANLDYRNSFYFDKTALSMGTTNDFQNATVYHWLHDDESQNGPTESGILESVRPPLESRIYYLYPGQSYEMFSGGITLRTPSLVARVVDDSSNPSIALTQTNEYLYNSQGRLLQYTDPIGRTTMCNYYPNGIDVSNVLQTDAGQNDTLAEYGAYNSQHRPSAYTNAAGMAYTFKWNQLGQLTNLVDPAGGVFVYTYGSNGYLLSVVQSGGGLSATNSFGYDFYGRVDAVTNAEGYYETFNYDNLNRLTQVTHPDGTSENYIYDKLNLFAAYDRTGNRTVWTYDGTGRPLTMRDRLNRLTQYSWCGCGGIASITDPLGHTTAWSHDVEGRVTGKAYADSTSVSYNYEARSSRLKSVTDQESQVKNYTYNVDDTLAGTSYSGAIVSTPSVAFGYDTNYDRLTMMSDGTGTTLYNYYPVTGAPSPGAGQLETVSNLFANATTVYQYDDLGRMTNRAIGSSKEGLVFDALGRVASDSSVLGAFAYSYAPSTYQLTSVAFPNGENRYFSYANNLGDQRLSGITNEDSWADILSQFNYQYDLLGRITQWSQNVPTGIQYLKGAPIGFTNIVQTVAMQNDAEGQLRVADITPSWTNQVGSSYSYSYDAAGNRVGSQFEQFVFNYTQPVGGSDPFPTVVSLSTYNSLNQLTNRSGNGALPVNFRGIVNQSAVVTVAADTNTITGTSWTPTTIAPADISSNPASGGNSEMFNATISLPPNEYGPQPMQPLSSPHFPPISVTAQGGTYSATNTYNLDLVGDAGKVYSYDPNGNCTNVSMAGTNITYQWDAENRLVGINTYISNSGALYSSMFSYDGFDRRAQVVEATNGVSGSPERFVWDGTQLCQERDGNNNVIKQFFDDGEQINGTNYYYQEDHLGTVWSMTDSTGTMQACYAYDPYGQQTQLGGTVSSDFGFAGYYHHAPSGLYLTVYRAYDPSQGRWINRDPIEEDGGINLYEYAGNDAINLCDPEGLDPLGHHLVPRAIWKNLSDRVKKIWDDPKNRLDAKGYKKHNFKSYGPKNGPKVRCKDYNKAVGDELDKYLKEKGVNSPEDLSDQELQDFADQIRSTTDGDIGAYNQGVADEIAESQAAAAEGAEAAETAEALTVAAEVDEAVEVTAAVVK